MYSEMCFKKEVEKDLATARREGDVVIEAESGAIHFEQGRSGHKPSNTRSLEVERHKETDFPLRASRAGSSSADTLTLT